MQLWKLDINLDYQNPRKFQLVELMTIKSRRQFVQKIFFIIILAVFLKEFFKNLL